MLHKRLQKVLAVFSLLALLLLLGCTQMTREQKTLCFVLASKSYSYAPQCDTEASCFDKVNELFKTKLGYEQEGKLYELKNHVARSWFFYNKAVVQAGNASMQCQAGDAAGLTGAVNQMRLYLDTAFLELDEGMKESFELIAQQEKFLSEQKIEEVKEEKVYESLLEIQRVLSELKTGETNSGSYVSYYMARAREYNNSSASRGFSLAVENRPFWIDAYFYVEGEVMKKLGYGEEAGFPFLHDAMKGAIAEAESAFYTSQSLSVLQNLPVSEFMKLYSDLGGSNDSALKRFADLENRASVNLETAQNNSEELWKKTDESRFAAEQSLKEATKVEKYAGLYDRLVGGVLNTKKDQKEFFLEEQLNFLKLREQKATGTLSLGEELSGLKSAENAFEQIIAAQKMFGTEYYEKLLVACSKKAGDVKTQSATASLIIEKILDDAKYFATKTLSSEGEERLGYCEQMLEKQTIFEKAKSDKVEFEEKLKQTTKDCISYLDKVFSLIDLGGLEQEYNSIKETELTKDNLLLFEESCEQIKQQAENELNGSPQAVEFKNAVLEINNLENVLKKIYSYSPSERLDKEILDAKTISSIYSDYFNGEQIRFDTFLPAEGFLPTEARKSSEELLSKIQEEIIAYAKKDYKLTYLNTQILEVNREYEINARLFIPNPFLEIKTQFSIDANLSTASMQEKGECIQQIIKLGDKSSITLSCLPLGGATAILRENISTTTSEQEKIILATNEESVIQRSINLKLVGEAQKLLVRTKLFQQTKNSTVFVNGKEINSAPNGEYLEFVVDKAGEDTKIAVFFYAGGLVEVNENMLGAESNALKQIMRYTITAKNTTAQQLDATLLLGIQTNASAKNAEIYDAAGERQSYTVANGKIVLKNQNFLPKEEKVYSAVLEIDSALEYYKNELLSQAQELELLGDYVGAADSREIALAAANSGILGLKDAAQKNNEKITRLRQQKESETNLGVLKQKFSEKIVELRQRAAEMLSDGLVKEAQKIQLAIQDAQKLIPGNANDVAKASLLLDKISFDVDDGIVSSAKEIYSQSEKIAQGQDGLQTILKDILDEKEFIEARMAFEPENARKAFSKMEKNFAEIKNKKDLLDKTALEAKKNREELVQGLFEKNTALAALLEQELYSPQNEGGLIKAKLVPPITEARLKKLELENNKTNSSDDTLEEKLSALKKISDELNGAMDYLKKEAVKRFNSAIDEREDKQLLATARALIDENKFVGAMLALSGSNAPLLGGASAAIIIPIILIVGVAFFLKRAFEKKQKMDEEKKKIVLNEWND